MPWVLWRKSGEGKAVLLQENITSEIKKHNAEKIQLWYLHVVSFKDLSDSVQGVFSLQHNPLCIWTAEQSLTLRYKIAPRFAKVSLHTVVRTTCTASGRKQRDLCSPARLLPRGLASEVVSPLNFSGSVVPEPCRVMALWTWTIVSDNNWSRSLSTEVFFLFFGTSLLGLYSIHLSLGSIAQLSWTHCKGQYGRSSSQNSNNRSCSRQISDSSRLWSSCSPSVTILSVYCITLQTAAVYRALPVRRDKGQYKASVGM